MKFETIEANELFQLALEIEKNVKKNNKLMIDRKIEGLALIEYRGKVQEVIKMTKEKLEDINNKGIVVWK